MKTCFIGERHTGDDPHRRLPPEEALEEEIAASGRPRLGQELEKVRAALEELDG